jgi:hypothetical protein
MPTMVRANFYNYTSVSAYQLAYVIEADFFIDYRRQRRGHDKTIA